MLSIVQRSILKYQFGPGRSLFHQESYMGPVPQVSQNTIWDWSHRYLRITYGIGPIYVSLSHTWDQSHRCLTSIYGTGPIGISQPAMGPHAKIFMMESHTYLRTIYGTGPMDISEIRMGLVPYVSESYTWDWSHRWFSNIQIFFQNPD